MSARASILAERDSSPVLWGFVGTLPVELSRLSARIANKILATGEIDDRARIYQSSVARSATVREPLADYLLSANPQAGTTVRIDGTPGANALKFSTVESQKV